MTCCGYGKGLGYYRRARQLHRRPAKIVARTRRTTFPPTRPTSCSLPGIGRYTAGAILSIAFDQPAPILEANTVRLHSRLLAIADDPTSRAAQELLWQFAARTCCQRAGPAS